MCNIYNGFNAHNLKGYKMDYNDQEKGYNTGYGESRQRIAQEHRPSTPPPQKKNGIAHGIGSFFSGIWRVIKYIFIAFSLLGNLVLLSLIVFAIAIGYAGYKGGESFSRFGTSNASRYKERVIQRGNPQSRIAVVDVIGLITDQTVEQVKEQFNAISQDNSVCGVIIKIQSPGGLVSSSDNLHYQIQKLMRKKKIPIIAFASGITASGGYYAAVACDEIIAEPTAITGSIGVIMQTFTMKELFETKLGITPVTIKSGEKKDWPNSFRNISEQELDYIDSKLIKPAYERFVELVDNGRPNLSREQLMPLADGSIFPSDEAYEKGLIDGVGYIDKAIKTVCDRAEISNPEVFGYTSIFSFADFMQMEASKSNNILNAGKDFITELQSPALMYLWVID